MTDIAMALIPGIVFLAGMVLLIRAERHAHAIPDEASRRRRLTMIDWATPTLIAGFIVTVMGRNHDIIGLPSAGLDVNSIRGALPWIAVMSLIWALGWTKPGDHYAVRLLARLLFVAPAVLSFALLPAVWKFIGAPWWGLNVLLFPFCVLVLRRMPSNAQARYALDDQAADETLARLSPDQQAHVSDLLQRGRKIEAVRDLRNMLGLDLRAAKMAADRMEERFGAAQKSPEAST